jgi:hypothetical protein
MKQAAGVSSKLFRDEFSWQNAKKLALTLRKKDK